jgi:hypothetical protein
MRRWGLCRHAVAACAAVAFLAACGISRSPIDAPGPMPQAVTRVAHVGPGGSWMQPEATTDDPLYVVREYSNEIGVYTYRGTPRHYL